MREVKLNSNKLTLTNNQDDLMKEMRGFLRKLTKESKPQMLIQKLT